MRQPYSTRTLRARVRALCPELFNTNPQETNMLLLTIYRPELARVTPPADHSPFEGYEVIGLFEDEAAVDREITYWQQREGRNWKFHYEDAPTTLAEKWAAHARELGEIHSKNAASWVTDGNESDESRRRKLKLMDEGDPAIEQFMPERPSLSGEWASDYTAEKLIEEVTGRDPTDVDMADREAITNAWEMAVEEHFGEECEKELRKWVN